MGQKEIERDVAKRWKKDNFRLACIGFENQKQPDADMPLRVIGYDGADYLVQKQRTGTYVGSTQTLEHVQETLGLMSVMTGDSRFEEALNETGYEEIKNMCEVLDRIEARGEKRGITIGEERGAFRIVSELVKDGLISLSDAVKSLGISEEEFERRVAEKSN